MRIGVFLSFMALSIPIATELCSETISPDDIMTVHSDAIQLGAQEYIQNSLAYDPDFRADGYYGDLDPDEKRQAALDDFNDIFAAFLKGDAQDVESITRIARYCPIFSVDYLLKFEGDFPTEELAGAIQIVELDKRSAELDIQLAQSQAELAQSQAELAQSQAELRAAFGELAEVMISKGMGTD